MIRLILPILFISCQPELAIPTCSNIEATRSGERIEIKISSEDPGFVMCREFVGGTVCTHLSSNHYGCISIRGNAGDVIRFISATCNCELIIK